MQLKRYDKTNITEEVFQELIPMYPVFEDIDDYREGGFCEDNLIFVLEDNNSLISAVNLSPIKKEVTPEGRVVHNPEYEEGGYQLFIGTKPDYRNKGYMKITLALLLEKLDEYDNIGYLTINAEAEATRHLMELLSAVEIRPSLYRINVHSKINSTRLKS